MFTIVKSFIVVGLVYCVFILGYGAFLGMDRCASDQKILNPIMDRVKLNDYPLGNELGVMSYKAVTGTCFDSLGIRLK